MIEQLKGNNLKKISHEYVRMENSREREEKEERFVS